MYRCSGRRLDGPIGSSWRDAQTAKKKEGRAFARSSFVALTGGRSEIGCGTSQPAAAIELPTSVNLLDACLPRVVRDTMQTTAMRARRRAYSTRAAPRSLFTLRRAEM